MDKAKNRHLATRKKYQQVMRGKGNECHYQLKPLDLKYSFYKTQRK